MKPDDKQEMMDIFEFVTGKLLEQNQKSIDEAPPDAWPFTEYCRLRSKKGLRCAIGWMIPDSVYKEQWRALERGPEPVTTLAALGLYEVCFGRKFPEKTELLKELQYVHDYEAVDVWAHEFKRIKDKIMKLDDEMIRDILLREYSGIQEKVNAHEDSDYYTELRDAMRIVVNYYCAPSEKVD